MNTKIAALKIVKSSGRAGELRAMVLKVLAETGPQTGRAVAELLEHSEFLSSIRARINELCKTGEVVQCGYMECPVSGHKVHLYALGDATAAAKKPDVTIKKILKLFNKLAKRNDPNLAKVAEYVGKKYGKV